MEDDRDPDPELMGLIQALNPSSDSEEEAEPGQLTDIRPQIEKFLRTKYHKDFSSILSFWEQHKYVLLDLYQLAQVVYSVPATSASVERLFSSLKLTLHHQRARMGQDILNAILVMKNNYTAFESRLSPPARLLKKLRSEDEDSATS